MKFRNYCVVFLGEVEGTKEEIVKISETSVNFIKGTGFVMATFSSVATPSELKSYFQTFNRNFFLFELGNDNYGVNLTSEPIYKHLFGQYEEGGDSFANELTTKLFKTINQSTSGETVEETAIDVETMDETARNELLDKILDKGIENWDDSDKIIVEKLTKK